MQTFLPYDDFMTSAQCLDNRRLGKQRVEAWQIYHSLKQGELRTCNRCHGTGINAASFVLKCSKCKGKGKIKTPWYNHPATQIWKGHEKALLIYAYIICCEWIKRGFKDNILDGIRFELSKTSSDMTFPSLISYKPYHASHRSNLLRKNPEWYGQFGWKEPNDLPYVWVLE